jgi:hypothetical protein
MNEIKFNLESMERDTFTESLAEIHIPEGHGRSSRLWFWSLDDGENVFWRQSS